MQKIEIIMVMMMMMMMMMMMIMVVVVVVMMMMMIMINKCIICARLHDCVMPKSKMKIDHKRNGPDRNASMAS